MGRIKHTPSGKVAKAIERERERAGLTVKEAAARAKMPPTQWYEYESGRREPRASTFARIAQSLGVAMESLLR